MATATAEPTSAPAATGAAKAALVDCNGFDLVTATEYTVGDFVISIPAYYGSNLTDNQNDIKFNINDNSGVGAICEIYFNRQSGDTEKVPYEKQCSWLEGIATSNFPGAVQTVNKQLKITESEGAITQYTL